MCKIASGESGLPSARIWESSLALAFHLSPPLDERPMLGHILIVPVRHVGSWADLSEDEASDIGKAAARLARPLTHMTNAERIYSAVIGHQSDHFHLHLFPRYPGTPKEFWFARVNEWPNSPKGDAEEIGAFVRELRGSL